MKVKNIFFSLGIILVLLGATIWISTQLAGSGIKYGPGSQPDRSGSEISSQGCIFDLRNADSTGGTSAQGCIHIPKSGYGKL